MIADLGVFVNPSSDPLQLYVPKFKKIYWNLNKYVISANVTPFTTTKCAGRLTP